MNASRCRSCGAAIIWATTPNRRRIPMDVKAVANGNVALRLDGDQLVAEPAPEGHTGPRHQAHFASCPDYAEWRKAH
ncbi:MAG: hypothetical protein ACRD4T_00025 [Candidatus Acidiferrales bacterium]